MICSQGSCLLRFDNGKELKEITLDSNNIGIEVQPGVWGEQEYLEDNTTLIVLSDHHYDEEDYLRDYNDFKDFILNKML
jgi:UDP-2-acetamido-3-amino-2,3-dideoxy-glucuronate N-acetyltransferase